MSGKNLWFAVLAILMAVAVVLFFFFQFSAMDDRLAVMQGQLERALDTVGETAQRAEEAHSRAIQAEENALRAAQDRDLAEAEKAAADERTEEALKDAAQAREEMEKLRREREEELNRLQRSLEKIVETRRTALGLVMNLDSDFIQFAFDRAELKAEHRELLSRIAGILMTSSGYRVQVFGHTDDVGTAEYNQELSLRRAEVVRDYLVSAGIDPELIATEGFGKSRPLVEDTTPAARHKNRRVEIGIIDTLVQYKSALTGSVKP